MYTPKRVYVPLKAQPILEELMAETGLEAAEIFTLFLTRYGSHYLSWHRSNPHQVAILPSPAPVPVIEIPEENLPAIEL